MKSVLASSAAVLVAAVCAACATSHGTTAGEAVPDLAAYPAETDGGASVTLGAATVAAQAIADEFSAADYASVWENMTTDVRHGISKADFVAFYQTCKKPGERLSVSAVRMEPDGQAVVHLANDEVGGDRYMVYEQGVWHMRATEGFAAHLGQPLQRVIGEETAAGLCGR